MAFEYIETADAITAAGVRMTVVSAVPSPWGEAAKGILHVKQIPWQAVRLDTRDAVQSNWTGKDSAPVLFYNQEAPINRWDEILLFAERIAPDPALLPADESLRQAALILSNEICGPQGLGWYRRISAIHAGLQGTGGFIKPAAEYLAPKYGYTPAEAALSGDRVIALLNKLTQQLQLQSDRGSPYYLGDRLTCVDIYSATFCALFKPLAEDVCDMRAATRAAFEDCDAQTRAALSPAILNHRDRMYRDYLELPLSL